MTHVEEKFVTYIDPPSGWKYGFPKIIPRNRLKDSINWIVEQGYPADEIASYGEQFYCRYWTQEVEEDVSEQS